MMLSRISAGPRWVRLLLIGLLTAIALAVGFTGGVFAGQLTAPGTDSPEAGFARDMSTHHAQAVELAMTAYPKATQPEVRIWALDIATSQEFQIGQMQTWLEQWHLDPTGDRAAMAWMPNGANELRADGLMPGMATDAERAKLRAATGIQVDILFCQLMIRHHLGGLHMIEGALKLSHNGQVRELAQGMYNLQRGEVDMMQQLLKELGAPLN